MKLYKKGSIIIKYKNLGENTMENLILTLIIGLIGGYIADKRKIPAGFMVGSLFAVAIFNIIFDKAVLPTYFRFITQVATGTYLGTKFYKKDMKSLKQVLIPGIFMSILMIAFSLIISYIMSKGFDIDYVTAAFASSPGGLMDMSLLAYEFDANTSQVALLQLIRMISVIIFVPFFSKKCYGKIKKKEVYESNNKEKKLDKIKIEKYNFLVNYDLLLITIIIGIFGGSIGYFLKIPAGAMSCSMLAVAIFNVKTEKSYMPLTLRKIIQSVGGALIGSRVSLEDVVGIKELFFPIIIIIIGFCLMNILVGFLLYRVTNFSLMTSLLSAAPGGMSDIAIMAEDLGADASQVAMTQFIRVCFIISIYPIIIRLLFV